jgi:DNA-directed RNA polymerase subunit RPC12/RpoP
MKKDQIKRGPESGVKIMRCLECEHEFNEFTRDLHSMSDTYCQRCGSSDILVRSVLRDEFWTQNITQSTAAKVLGLLEEK